MKKQLLSACLSGCVVIAALLGGCDRVMGIPGGKFTVKIDQQVAEIAAFAVKEQEEVLRKNPETPDVVLSLVRVLGAKQQVVAGRNHFITLKVKLDGKERQAEATVFQDFDPEKKTAPFQLTQWKWR